MPGTTSSFDPKMENKGFIIQTDDSRTPSLVPATGGYCGIESHQELLYILAIDVMYKFRCEHFEDKFEATRKFVATHYQKNVLMNKPWFKSKERKLLDTYPDSFYKEFKKTLLSDLSNYWGDVARPLVLTIKTEIAKLEV